MGKVKKILKRDPSVVNPDKRTLLKRTPICIALRSNASKDVLQELLNAGCSPNTCTEHKSVLQCACDHQDTEFKTDVLTLLIQDRADLTENDELGRSLCYGLRRTSDVDFVNLLVSKGCSLSSCTCHESALICLMYRDSEIVLTAEIVKFLAEEGVNPHVPNLQAQDILYPLDMALRSGVYETPAIEALIDLAESYLPRPNYTHWSRTSLFSAILNEEFKASTIELLIYRGANVSSRDSTYLTALHWVVRLPTCSKAVLKLLTKNNYCKNDWDSSIKTPLQLCIEFNSNESHAAVIFVHGCRLHNPKAYIYLDLRMNMSISASREPEKLRYYKLLLKYSLLEEDEEFNRNPFVRGEGYPELYDFAEACYLEISQMREINISEDLTLYEFVVRDRDDLENPIITAAHRDVTLTRLLNAMSSYKFNIYYDIIAAYFPLKAFKETLEKMINFLGTPNAMPNGEKMPFNCEVVLSLCDYLPQGDALKLIIAYMPPFIPV